MVSSPSKHRPRVGRLLVNVLIGATVSIGLLAPALLSIPSARAAGPFEGPVPRANCGPGSSPETGIQGDVPQADRSSGRSQLGYRCNLELVGQFQAQGAGWQNSWYGHCDYFDTKTGVASPPTPVGTGNGQTVPGTQVIDVSDPAHPVRTANLDTPALDGPWESLKVNEKRSLLAGVGGFGSDGDGPLYFDVYDLKTDCAHPKLLSSTVTDLPLGHEGNWATDGMTYYGTSLGTGTVSAIDVTDPTNPSVITVFRGGNVIHGVATSDDGNRLYIADIAATTPDGSGNVNGLEIWDISAIQSRQPGATATPIGHVYWSDGSTAQHPIPITYGGKPYILFVDEGGYGAARIIDISNEASPVIVSKLKLEIHMPANQATAAADSAGNGSFTYQGHYCAVDREVNPTAAACGYFQSGIRVFDIRDPLHPREIAYFNPPAQVAKHGQLPGSEHDGGPNNSQPPNMTADWCSSQIRFTQAADGTPMLWAQCQDNGFMALKFTNGAYPLTTAAVVPEAPWTAAIAGLGLVIIAAVGRRRIGARATRTARMSVRLQ